MTVETLIAFAYDLKQYQIVGGPEWLRRDPFDINAKAARDVPLEQIKLMARSLLEDRFRLAAHTDTREMRYLALVLARPDGRLGPYILPLGDDCNAASAEEVAKAQFPPRPADARGTSMRSRCSSLSSLADLITAQSGVPAIDGTGLTGKFAIDMRYAPRPLTAGAPPVGDPNLPSFETALEEQAGFKLEPRRGPIEVLVIDSIQPPAEN